MAGYPLVDSHVNLHSDKYEADEVDEIVQRARDANVKYMLTISDQLSSTKLIKPIADKYDFMWRSVGTHPHYAKDAGDITAQQLIALSNDKKVIGIGECGLDFFYEYSDREAQQKVFAEHIIASQETGLPLIIHTRDADDLMQDIVIKAYEKKPFLPLLHCYTSGEELAKNTLSIGGYISFSGILTFKNAEEVRAIAQMAPLDRIIIETDCPYLAPVPMRGRRNEPAYLVHVAEKLAELKNVTVEEVSKITTDNFFRLFSAAKPQDFETERTT